MKLLFITPPIGNWAPLGDRHIAVNSLYSQLASFVREKNAAQVEVLDWQETPSTQNWSATWSPLC